MCAPGVILAGLLLLARVYCDPAIRLGIPYIILGFGERGPIGNGWGFFLSLTFFLFLLLFRSREQEAFVESSVVLSSTRVVGR
ncbi:hypothetical protein B0H16DRAFT_1612789 [Mycena metata]|uniref:Uncharacterized protein n=1 Tax=Mycena metata TaxID=1033252 RepID=A0AAD7HCM3_9AGAR|nr:hypothetical protein B0H16DRAFT_1612789 [Mycena metata]